MNEQLKILEMIESGRISAADGMELLNALKTTDQPDAEPSALTAEKLCYKFLRIKVTSDNNSVNVNVNLPIKLLTTLGEIATNVTAYIPADARAHMEAKGVDIRNIDFSQIIQDLLNGTLDDPHIVDVEAWDEEHNTMIKVKIYAE